LDFNYDLIQFENRNDDEIDEANKCKDRLQVTEESKGEIKTSGDSRPRGSGPIPEPKVVYL